ncbi:hypothetical protein [Puniceibacterium sp. IMCC21224]|uniref:hypothetical protein n=1 Tax=Puniceibacterium sp. IMCC21224 TaxID=1618204 RepID=UPI00065CE7FD|nr:hypothetical protein [Puniceibacterium sp. IMCC21224]KMK66809.1 hypothetical protein IMCC21224_111666 [Puniceibacterium sp. IMCC21224]
MSARLLLWLNAPDCAWLDPADTPMALGTLLVMVARDHPGAIGGMRDVDETLARHHHLTAAEATEMRRNCEIVADQAPPWPVLADLLSANVPDHERRALLSCLPQNRRGLSCADLSHVDLHHLLGLDPPPGARH